jgi:transposase
VAQNFLPCERDQELLLPLSLREWLPEDHLAWFVLDAVEQIDLSAFYAAYRADGRGRAAFEPEMMLALLLYAYAVGERSSRAIERRCREDIAFRVIAANQVPDHATIARFRARHEGALGELFSEVLRLCAGAGLVALGLIALDGTKLAANASLRANRPYASICAEVEAILAEAAAADAAEDARLGDQRGDELPEGLGDRRSRRARLQAAKAKLEAELTERAAAHEARLAERARLEATRGTRLRGRKPVAPPARVDPAAHANTTDPDSALVRGANGFVQGFNAQVVSTTAQIVVAAELSTDSPDARLLAPMAEAARDELARIGHREAPGVLVADAGYWNVPQIEALAATGLEVLVAPDSPSRRDRDAGARKLRDKRPAGRYLAMRRALASPRGRALYALRRQLVEPIFGQTKAVRRCERFQRRGLAACRSEWRLIMATHNLLKLWRHQTA